VNVKFYQSSTAVLTPSGLLQFVGYVSSCILNVLGVFIHPRGNRLCSGRSKCIMVCFFSFNYKSTLLNAAKEPKGMVYPVCLLGLWLKIPCYQALGSVQVRDLPVDNVHEKFRTFRLSGIYDHSRSGVSELRFLASYRNELFQILSFANMEAWDNPPFICATRKVDIIPYYYPSVWQPITGSNIFSCGPGMISSKPMDYGGVMWSRTGFRRFHRSLRPWYVVLYLKLHLRDVPGMM